MKTMNAAVTADLDQDFRRAMEIPLLPAQEQRLREALQEIGMPVFGVLPRETDMTLPVWTPVGHRRLPASPLGQTTAKEREEWEKHAETLSLWIERYVDVVGIENMMQSALALDEHQGEYWAERWQEQWQERGQEQNQGQNQAKTT